MARVLVCSTAAVDEHITGAGHPEQPARLKAAMRGIGLAELGDCIVWIPGRQATHNELARVHTAGYLAELEQFVSGGGADLDPDTSTSVGSWSTALWAAGSCLAAVEAMAPKPAAAAFVLIRPPGHHAGAANGAGFCLLNNVAITAAALKERGERVLIVDWDVHHGNGTQAIFWNEPDVLYVSTHEWPAYPGTGRASETGGPDAVGLTVNVPLPARATGDIVREALTEVAGPVIALFKPTWVLISAGFDAHRDDPLADLMLTAGDFADLAQLVSGFAPMAGRVVAVLEGGYDLDALANCVGATVAQFAGVHWRPESASSGGPGRAAIDEARRLRLHPREVS